MKELSVADAKELHKLLTWWLENPSLPTTPAMPLVQSKDDNVKDGPIAYQSIAKDDLESALRDGKIILPGLLNIEDLENPIQVGSETVPPIVVEPDADGIQRVDFGNVAVLGFSVWKIEKSAKIRREKTTNSHVTR